MPEWFLITAPNVTHVGGQVPNGNCFGPFRTKAACVTSVALWAPESIERKRAGLYQAHCMSTGLWIGTRAELRLEGWILPDQQKCGYCGQKRPMHRFTKAWPDGFITRMDGTPVCFGFRATESTHRNRLRKL